MDTNGYNNQAVFFRRYLFAAVLELVDGPVSYTHLTLPTTERV